MTNQNPSEQPVAGNGVSAPPAPPPNPVPDPAPEPAPEPAPAPVEAPVADAPVPEPVVDPAPAPSFRDDFDSAVTALRSAWSSHDTHKRNEEAANKEVAVAHEAWMAADRAAAEVGQVAIQSETEKMNAIRSLIEVLQRFERGDY